MLLEFLLELLLSENDEADTSDQEDAANYNESDSPSWHSRARWLDVSVLWRDTWVLHKCDLLILEVPHDTLEAVEDSVADQEQVIDVAIAVGTS